MQLHSECERLRLRVLSMERSGGLKKYEGSAYSDKDLEDFLRSCGDDKVWARCVRHTMACWDKGRGSYEYKI